jgi:hypothetical protein
MRDSLQASVSSACFLVLSVFLLFVSGNVTARESSIGIPDNARAKNFGSGWECYQGFREEKLSCVAVRLPENAHLDRFGTRLGV